MKRIISSIIFILFAQLSTAVPPMPGVTSIPNGDGTYINARIFGDDFFHYAITDDGYLIGMSAEGINKGFYVYAYTNEKGEICLTDERVGSPITKGSKRQAGMPQYAEDMAQTHINKMQSLQRKGLLTKSDETGGQRGPSSIKDRRGIVILIGFPDLPFTYTNSDYTSMLNQNGYSQNGGIGSAADYFNDNALGKTTFKFDVFGPIRVSKPYGYYGTNNKFGFDTNAAELCAEAVHLAVKNFNIDISQYDQDNDGDIDMVFYFFAGHGEAQGASANHIWPHKSTVNTQYTNGVSDIVNGKNIRTYACAAELKGNKDKNMDGIGTFCHEYSHVLGLTDIYDTDKETNGLCAGMGSYSVMDSGSYNINSTTPPYYLAFERITVGWMDEADILEDKNSYKLCKLDNIKNNDAVVINSGTPGMKYYFEARDKSKWNAGIPKEGVLVYMIDKSGKKVAHTGYTAKQLWNNNKPNSSPDAPCAMIIHANNGSHKGRISESVQRGWVYPYGSNKDITPSSTPSSISRYDSSDFFHAKDITYNSDGTGSFVLGESKIDFTKAFPFISIQVPQGGFTTSSTLEITDTDNLAESVVWYINGIESKTIIKGSNNEIKAKVNLKDGTTQIIYKLYSL